MIKFPFKLRKTARETHEILPAVYGYEAISRTRVFRRFRRYRERLEDVLGSINCSKSENGCKS
jgi:hypothetical protein